VQWAASQSNLHSAELRERLIARCRLIAGMAIISHDGMLTDPPTRCASLLTTYFSQHIAAGIPSARYTAFVRQHLAWTLVAVCAVLLCGWTLAEYLGGIYRRNVQQEARADVDLLANRLAGETATVEGMVEALAGSPSVLTLLKGSHDRDKDAGRASLDLDVSSSGAKRGYLLYAFPVR
jgi:hypothetical protein